MIRVFALLLSVLVGISEQVCDDGDALCPNAKSYCYLSNVKQICKNTCELDTAPKCSIDDCLDEIKRDGCCGTCKNFAGFKWSEWSDWVCDVECGQGTETRSRTCLTGNDCVGESTESDICRKPPCSTGNCGEDASWCSGVTNKQLCITNQFVKLFCKAFCCEPSGGGCGVDMQPWCRNWKDSCDRLAQVKLSCPATCCKDNGGPKWSDWSEWVCDVNCGRGEETRTRTCETGNDCIGDSTEKQICSKPACQGRWGPWDPWEDCDATCGKKGTTWRYRKCEVLPCVGSSSESQECDGPPCPKWGDWGKWSKCSVDCGEGEETRNRKCLIQPCQGPATESRVCNLEPCSTGSCGGLSDKADWCSDHSYLCESDDYVLSQCRLTCCNKRGAGRWSDWSDWICDVDCGKGTETRTRKCETGNNCIGDATESRECTKPSCGECSDVYDCKSMDGYCWLPAIKENCKRTCKACKSTGETIAKWGEWKWGDCSKSCGPGTQKATRVCSVSNKCSGDAEKSRDCKIKDCDTQRGVWDDWGGWEQCTETCGPGTRTRKRRCLGPGECSGEESAIVDCNLRACKTIEWKPWKPWGKCSEECGTGTRTRKRECSIANKCSGNSVETRNCKLKECELGEWTDWTECTMSCKPGGTQSRSRECTVEGKCEGMGSIEESRDCNEDVTCGAPGYSPCSRTCGYGTQYKYMCYNGICGNIYASCRLKTCAKEVCLPTKGFKDYYGFKGQCCKINDDDKCGRDINNQRIIGGVPAKALQWNWMVAVKMDSDDEFCGASLISSRWLISAAHCFQFDDGTMRTYSDWKLVVGVLEFTEQGESPPDSTHRGVEEVHVHPEYSFPSNDIALVKMNESVSFHPTVRPICMPGGEEPSQDATCYVMGWGVTDVKVKSISQKLNEVDLQVFDNDACVQAYRRSDSLKYFVPWLKKSKDYYCAGSIRKTVDSCQGDSGGPLVCQRCSSCTWYIAGIVSFGPQPCATHNEPAIYTKVKSYESWIKTTAGVSEDKAPVCAS